MGMKTTDENEDEDENEIPKSSYLEIGNWFLLGQIGRNSNPYYFRKFVQSIEGNNDIRETNNIDAKNGLNNSCCQNGLAGMEMQPIARSTENSVNGEVDQ